MFVWFRVLRSFGVLALQGLEGFVVSGFFKALGGLGFSGSDPMHVRGSPW